MFSRTVRQFGILVALAVTGGTVVAQEHNVIPLIPAANWHLVSTQPMGLEAIQPWGGDPAIEREFGVKTVALRTYHLADQKAELLFEEALDTSSAYGLFTFYQTAVLVAAKGMEMTRIGPQGAIMARGRFLIRARPAPDSKVSQDKIQALLILVGGTRPAQQDAASIPAPLPVQGLIEGSERYLLGLEAANRVLPKFRTDLIGFTQGAEALVGNYTTRGARATVLAITYPTPQIARERFAVMESLLDVNKDRGTDSVFGRRASSYVILVLDSGSESAAKKLMDQFHVTANVSWNERAPDPSGFTIQVVRLVLANIMLSFIIFGFALGGGIMIFLSRRAATKWFPDSWADPEHDHLIRIKLN